MPTSRFKRLILGTGLAGTDNGDNTITVTATGAGGGGPAAGVQNYQQLKDTNTNYAAVNSAYVNYAAVNALSSIGGDVLWDAKGDLATGTGPNTAARLPVGSDNQVLTADSAQTLGVKWATPTAAGAWTLLSTTTLASSGLGLDVPSLSQSYNDLILIAIVRSNWAGGNADEIHLQFNGDTGARYNWGYVGANAGTVTGSGTGAASFIKFPPQFPTAAVAAGMYGVMELVVFGYTSSTWNKYVSGFAWIDDASNGRYTASVSGTWLSTAAINRVTLTAGASGTQNFGSGSQLRIYGRL